jgi:regulator of sirC expression with transglutaminase-like and TPR domain
MHREYREVTALYLRFTACTALLLCGLAQADPPARTWEFDVKAAGTYKVQVEHLIRNEAPQGTKVTYSITIGTETQARDLDLIANRPFIPLIVEIRHPSKMRVAVSGLSQPELNQTRVYTYEASSVPPGQYFDPARNTFKETGVVRNILEQPAEAIDLARTKLIIDRMIDPTIDVEANLKKIDAMVTSIRMMREFGPANSSRLLALKRYIHESGAWNDYRPFQYDLDDPFGHDIRNKLLSVYVESRKGNCVTMPLFFIILGQRLGLDVTASTAPKHLLVKWKSEAGLWVNLEATSGANPARDVWIRSQMPMTDQAIANGVYLQPLTKKETVAVMATTLAEYYLQQREYEKAIAIADVVLEYHPKNVGTMTLKAAAYGRLVRQRFAGKYPSPSQIPVSERSYYEYLAQNNHLWFAKAEALGWREETKEQEARYLQGIDQARHRRAEH